MDPSSSHTVSKRTILKNLLVLCLGFVLQFSAYQGLANLQSTMNSKEGIGVLSQSVIYAALITSSLFLPKLIIRRIGCKRTLVISVLTYCPYIAANFWPHVSTFIPSAFLVGLGAAPLWSAKCVYLNEIGQQLATVTNENSQSTVSRLFGVFFAFFGTTQIWGNLASYYVLKPTSNTYNETTNASSTSCGVHFCPSTTEGNPNMEPPSDHKRYLLTSVYLVSVIIASVILAAALDPLRKERTSEPGKWFAHAGATLRHMKKTEQLLLIPLTVYSGIEQAFFLGEFTQAYIACSWGIYHVGYVFICYGIVDASMSFVTGRLLKCIPRSAIMIAGCIGNICASVGMFLWSPSASQYSVFFVFAAVWGFSDAIWQTHINAFYGILFQEEEEAAFANYRLWESVGFLIAFVYSKYLCLSAKLVILLCFLTVGMCGYLFVEFKNRLRQKEISEKN